MGAGGALGGAVKGMLPAGLRAWLREWRADRRTTRSPDRAVLEGRVLPAFAASGGSVLWVGCRRYTRHYPAMLEARGATCHTLEIDPAAARWGRSGRHVVGSLLEVDRLYPAGSFDAVLCNGVLGFGVNEPAAQAQALAAMARILKPEGWLLLGWNTDRIEDPLATGLALRQFAPARLADLDQRIAVHGCTHVFDFLRRLPS